MSFVSCSTFNAYKAATDAAILALQTTVGGLGGAATPAEVLTAVQAMTPAQLTAMCTALDCAPSAAAVTDALLTLPGAGTAGNVLTVQTGGSLAFVAPASVSVPAASTTVSGTTMLATTAEVAAGTGSEAVTPTDLVAALNAAGGPNALQAAVGVAATAAGIGGGSATPDASETVKGKVELATVAEIQAGAAGDLVQTTSRVKAAEAAGINYNRVTLVTSGIATYASSNDSHGTAGRTAATSGFFHGVYGRHEGTGGNGSAVAGELVGGSTGHGVFGNVDAGATNTAGSSGVWGEVNNASDGAGVVGWYKGSGSGNGATIVNTGSGTGFGLFVLSTNANHGVVINAEGAGALSAVRARNGFGGAATESTVKVDAGATGNRLAAVEAVVGGANTTWGVWTNGAIFTSGGVTTSDRNVKRNILAIEGDALEAAVVLSREVQINTFTKLMARSSVKEQVARVVEEAKAELSALTKPVRPNTKDEKDLARYKREIEQYNARVSSLTKALQTVADVSDEALSLGEQAGVIAQDLRALLDKLGHFQWLVKDPKKGTKGPLSVDTESLQFIVQAGLNERLRRAGF